MKKICTACKESFIGRSDKQFCSVGCKNAFNNEKRKTTQNAVKEIDGYLHRNREILATVMPILKKEMFDRLILTRAGFKWDYCTGIYLNKEGKTYFIVYDYAWMAFSDQKIMVIRKAKKEV
jgi:hypothetical protein